MSDLSPLPGTHGLPEASEVEGVSKGTSSRKAIRASGSVMLLVSGGTMSLAPHVKERPDIFGTLVTPRSGNAIPETGRWAADNGAYSGFDAKAFRAMLARHQWAKERCLFVAAPDVVADARATMGLYWEWEPQIRVRGYRVALVAQDGLGRLRGDGNAIPWRIVDAVFIGGSTDWKLGRDAAAIATEAHARGKWVHMGRVNTRRRLRYAAALGVDSVDGSGWSKWSAAMLARHGELLRTLSDQRRMLLRSAMA